MIIRSRYEENSGETGMALIEQDSWRFTRGIGILERQNSETVLDRMCFTFIGRHYGAFRSFSGDSRRFHDRADRLHRNATLR